MTTSDRVAQIKDKMLEWSLKEYTDEQWLELCINLIANHMRGAVADERYARIKALHAREGDFIIVTVGKNAEGVYGRECLADDMRRLNTLAGQKYKVVFVREGTEFDSIRSTFIESERKKSADLAARVFEEERLWENRKDGSDVLRDAILSQGELQ